MLIIISVNPVQKISFKFTTFGMLIQFEAIVWINSFPCSHTSIKNSDFFIGIPVRIFDPLATKIIKSVTVIAVIFPFKLKFVKGFGGPGAVEKLREACRWDSLRPLLVPDGLHGARFEIETKTVDEDLLT